jgi:hypothetical protein
MRAAWRFFAVAASALGLAMPARAERTQTYWRLEPVGPTDARSAAWGAPFLQQRLLPIRLVRLTDAITVGRRTLPAGTLLYLVFNDEGRIGYCTIKDRSAGNQARTLFIPILDQRPCLVDRDNDGRFESSFSVYDKYGGPPSVRGSLNGAQPVGATAGFQEVDVHDFPVDMRMALSFAGPRDNPRRARVRVTFNGPIGGEWQEIGGAQTGEGVVFPVGNVLIVWRPSPAGDASFDVRAAPNAYISSDNRNRLYFNPLPAFLARN